jgi:uncharacterized membrane protein YqjE
MTTETRIAPRAAEPAASEADRSLGPLFSQLAQDSSALIRQEIALAKAEVRQSLSQTTSGALKLAIAVALLSLGGLVLTAFLVLLLGRLLDNYWVSALIVGVVFTIVGALLALAGLRRLKEVQVAPQETIETLKADRDWAKAEVQELKRDLKR